MTNQTIVSLALLKASWDQTPDKRTDYLDFFVPLIGETIFLRNADAVSVGEVQEFLEERSGIWLPQNVLNSVFKRLYIRGFLRATNGIYEPDKEKLREFNLDSARIEYLRKHDAIISKIVEFCLGRYEVVLVPNEANEALLAFLEDNHRMVTVLKSMKYGSVIPSQESVNISKFYLIAKYIEHIASNSPQEFQYLESIVKALMIANAVFLPTVESAAKEFKGTRIFLDTPILIYLLGYAGETMQKPSQELITLLRRSNAEICCFEHSLAEAQRIFAALAHQLQYNATKAYGPSIEYFLSQKLSPSDIIELSVSFPDHIKSIGIHIVEKPVSAADNHMMGEAQLEQELKPYKNPRALAHDVISVSAIYRIREGRERFTLEECDALFVTTNSRLVRVVRQHFTKEFSDLSVPLVMSDQSLTNVVWLKNPTDIPSAAKSRILADCFVAAQPTDELWERFLQKFDELKKSGEIDADRYYALRHATVTQSALMDVTLGDVDVFTEGTTHEVINLAIQRLRADDIKRAEEAEAREREWHKKETQELERKEERARQYAHVWIVIIKLVYVLVIAVIALISMPLSFSPINIVPFEQNWLRWILGIGLLIYFIATILDITKNIKLSRLSMAHLFDRIEKRLYRNHLEYLNK